MIPFNGTYAPSMFGSYGIMYFILFEVITIFFETFSLTIYFNNWLLFKQNEEGEYEIVSFNSIDSFVIVLVINILSAIFGLLVWWSLGLL